MRHSIGWFTNPVLLLQIEYADKHKMPFIGIGGGHDGSRALNHIQNGIGIWLRGQRGVEITSDGKEAVV